MKVPPQLLILFIALLGCLILNSTIVFAETNDFDTQCTIESTDAECNNNNKGEQQPTEQLDNDDTDNNNNNAVDYLIIGAGGGGIQTAILLQKYGHTVQILEKNHAAGSFWTKHPRFQELISVNKNVQNETQRYRYDWHSFLHTSIKMWDVSTDYFPSGIDFYNYMNRVVKDAKIDVQYGVEVVGLGNSDDEPCVTLLNGSSVCAKYRVFVATGLKEKDERYLEAMGGIKYTKMTKDLAVGKR